MVGDKVSVYKEEVTQFRIWWVILIRHLLRMTNSLNPEG